MSKYLFKCFLVYYEHVFVYCDVFAITISFSMSLLSIFEQISHLDLLLSVISFALSPQEATEVFFIKAVL